MSEILSPDRQNSIMDTACHQLQLMADAIAFEQTRPSTVYRPKLYQDGDKWCALYGADLMEGVAGFADSPAEAMADFDRAWTAKIGEAKP